MIFRFEFVENFESGEGDGDMGVSVWSVGIIVDVDDVGIVWGEGFEDIVVVGEYEGDGVHFGSFPIDISVIPYQKN